MGGGKWSAGPGSGVPAGRKGSVTSVGSVFRSGPRTPTIVVSPGKGMILPSEGAAVHRQLFPFARRASRPRGKHTPHTRHTHLCSQPTPSFEGTRGGLGPAGRARG